MVGALSSITARQSPAAICSSGRWPRSANCACACRKRPRQAAAGSTRRAGPADRLPATAIKARDDEAERHRRRHHARSESEQPIGTCRDGRRRNTSSPAAPTTVPRPEAMIHNADCHVIRRHANHSPPAHNQHAHRCCIRGGAAVTASTSAGRPHQSRGRPDLRRLHLERPEASRLNVDQLAVGRDKVGSGRQSGSAHRRRGCKGMAVGWHALGHGVRCSWCGSRPTMSATQGVDEPLPRGTRTRRRDGGARHRRPPVRAAVRGRYHRDQARAASVVATRASACDGGCSVRATR